ncbi:MAG: hypothetical protein K2Y23_02200 [Cyanobacteria bacterium]|nr:hypothetical protein [Cyanobacteriota bacterium]
MYVFSFKSIYEATSVQPVIAINRRNSEMFGISHVDAVGLKTTDYYADISHRERLREPLEKTGKADNILLHLGSRTAKRSGRERRRG